MKSQAFQAAAHLYVGGLIGAWLLERRGLDAVLIVILSLVELACFLHGKCCGTPGARAAVVAGALVLAVGGAQAGEPVRPAPHRPVRPAPRRVRDYRPRQPTLVLPTFQWALPDALGHVWEHVDPVWLGEFVTMRNAAIRAEDEAAAGRATP